MSKKLFHSSVLVLIAILPAAISPVLAQSGPVQQSAPLPTSGYGTGDNIQISGWEADLVRRNRGLEKFHWSPITTVKRYRTAPSAPRQSSVVQPAGPYHNTKPIVISTWSTQGRNTAADRTGTTIGGRASAACSSGQWQSPAASSDGNPGGSCNNGVSSYQTGPYDSVRSYGPRIAGRIMHY